MKPRTKKLLALVPHGPKIYRHKDDVLNDLFGPAAGRAVGDLHALVVEQAREVIDAALA